MVAIHFEEVTPQLEIQSCPPVNKASKLGGGSEAERGGAGVHPGQAAGGAVCVLEGSKRAPRAREIHAGGRGKTDTTKLPDLPVSKSSAHARNFLRGKIRGRR